MNDAGGSGLIVDIFVAAGVNIAAFVLAVIVNIVLGTLGPVLGTPFGVVLVSGLLIAWYGRSQIRKGRRRRAVLAGSITVISWLFIIYVGTHLRIA